MESSLSPAGGRAFRNRWEWSILFLPVAAVLLLLLSQLWITDGLAEAIAPPATGPGEVREFARGFIQISAAALVYVLICLAAIQYFWREVRAGTGPDRSAGHRRGVGVACAAIGVFGAALAVIHTFFPSFFAISRISGPSGSGTPERSGREWRTSVERMKANRDHWVALSTDAVVVLREARRGRRRAAERSRPPRGDRASGFRTGIRR